MIKEAIVLAGGFGTRLKEVVEDVPKPMAPIQDMPFLHYLMLYLKDQGIEHIVLSVGYKYEIIQSFFGNEYQGIAISYAIEKEALGTGGGIWNAMKEIEGSAAFVINGDTFFDVKLSVLNNLFIRVKNDFVMALKPMQNFDRYGTVNLDENKRIIAFCEKERMDEGMINGGIYILRKGLFEQLGLKGKFSFEQDFLEQYVKEIKLFAMPFDNYFIDIGIPTDYKQAQLDFKEIFDEE